MGMGMGMGIGIDGIYIYINPCMHSSHIPIIYYLLPITLPAYSILSSPAPALASIPRIGNGSGNGNIIRWVGIESV